MIEEGEQAPEFDLPGVRDGTVEQVALDEYLREDVVVLVFYPGDFNPACSGSSTDLDELDLFTMQKDVSVLAISGDSVFSHRAFEDEYDLHVPLLSDVHGEVAATYGVDVTDPDLGYAVRRAVFVIDITGKIEYAWVADDLEDLPDVEEIRERVEGIGGDETARARYRVGHAHYVEGRRAFTSAMHGYEDREWMVARSDFDRASEEFDRAWSEFDTAVRFSEDLVEKKYFDRAERKAKALWRAADWLGDSANAFAAGEGAEGEKLREDVEAPLETARDIHEPPPPDEFPPETDPHEEDGAVSILPTDKEDVDMSLTLDEEGAKKEGNVASRGGGETGEDPGGGTADGSSATDTEGTGEDTIDDDELEEITAELEQQRETVEGATDDSPERDSIVPDEPGILDDSHTEDESSPSPDDSASATAPGGTPATESGGDEAMDSDDGPDAANIEGELEEGDLELDLTDPTEEDGTEGDGEDDAMDGDDDLGDGSHGVPDSL